MFQVSWKRQLVLSLFLFLLGTGVYWLEFKHKPKKENLAELSKKVFPLKDVPVQSIRILDSKSSFELSCNDMAAKLCKSGDQSKWELKVPLKVKADDSNSNSVLSTLTNLTSTEVIDLREETSEKRTTILKEYGLDLASRKSATMRKIAIKTDKDESTAYFGSTHPIGEGIFVIVGKGNPESDGVVDDSKVFLVPSYFKSNFEHDLTYWRDKKIITVAAHEIQSFKLTGSKVTLSAERKEGQWVLKTGKEELAGDIENIDSLLAGVTTLSAKGFRFENKTEVAAVTFLKGAKKILGLSLQKQAGADKSVPAPFELAFYQKGLGPEDSKKPGAKTKEKPMERGKPGEKPSASDVKYFAVVSNLDPLFEMEGSSKDKIDKSLKDLRLTKLITSMERFGAKRLEFSGSPIGPTPLIFTQKDGKWLNAENKEPNKDKILDTLDKLSGNRIKDYLTGSAIPTGENEGLKFTLGDDKSEKKRQIVFWKKGNDLYARDLLSIKKEALLVDSTIKDALPWDGNFFNSNEPKPAAGQPSLPGAPVSGAAGTTVLPLNMTPPGGAPPPVKVLPPPLPPPSSGKKTK